MTEQPTPTSPPALPSTFGHVAPPVSSVRFPVGWLLDHGAPPIQYRAIVDVVRAPAVSRAVSALPYAYTPATALALTQSPDGTWSRSMLTLPSPRAEWFEGVGTIPAVRRLLEYGWDRESPPLVRARRILFRLLAEDDDPAYLFELAKGADDVESVRRRRLILREAAAAALAHAGYESDPRLRGAARRIVERIADFVRSPRAAKPWVRVGNQHVLAPDANPPSIFALTMLAHMPLFRNELHEPLDRIYQYVTQPLPRQEVVQLVGKKVVAQPQLVLGDMLPNRNAVDADVPWALTWLELMARLGYLRRNDSWTRLYERLLDDCDRDGVWHPHKGMAAARSGNPFVWPSYPLESSLAGEERWTDVTFRLGLIGRLSGRGIDVV